MNSSYVKRAGFTFFLFFFLSILSSCAGSRESDGIEPGTGAGTGAGNAPSGDNASGACLTSQRATVVNVDPIMGELLLVDLGGIVEARDSNNVCRLESAEIYLTSSLSSNVSSCLVDTSKDLENIELSYEEARRWRQQLNAYHYSYEMYKLIDLIEIGKNTLEAFPKKIRVDSHCDKERAAFYDPIQHSICLGFFLEDVAEEMPENSCGGNSDAIWASDDATVISHVFARAINRFLLRENLNYAASCPSCVEKTGVDIAVADYLASRLTGSDYVGDYFHVSDAMVVPRSLASSGSRKVYPSSLNGDPYNDGNIFSKVLYKIAHHGSNALGSKMDRIIIRTMQSLPVGPFSFAQAANELILQSKHASIDLTRNQILFAERTLMEGGFLRDVNGAATKIQLDTGAADSNARPYYIIDDFGFPGANDANNCDGELNEGETALIVINYKLDAGVPEPGLGLVISDLALIDDKQEGVHIVTGRGRAAHFRLDNGADKNFQSVLEDYSRNNWRQVTINAAFLVRADKANSSGAEFSLTARTVENGEEYEVTDDLRIIVNEAKAKPEDTDPRTCPDGEEIELIEDGKISQGLWPYTGPEVPPEAGDG